MTNDETITLQIAPDTPIAQAAKMLGKTLEDFLVEAATAHAWATINGALSAGEDFVTLEEPQNTGEPSAVFDGVRLGPRDLPSYPFEKMREVAHG
jgi:hypothetical protein